MEIGISALKKRLIGECSGGQHVWEEGKGQDWAKGEVGSHIASVEATANPGGSFEDRMAFQSLWTVRTRPQYHPVHHS